MAQWSAFDGSGDGEDVGSMRNIPLRTGKSDIFKNNVNIKVCKNAVCGFLYSLKYV